MPPVIADSRQPTVVYHVIEISELDRQIYK
jgi:hypothetical protein